MDNKNRKKIGGNSYKDFPNKLISSEDIEKLDIKWFMRNEIPKSLKQGCYMLNLDDSNGEGTHWTAFFINNDYLFYYDPFGITYMSGYAPKEIITLAKQMRLKLVENKYTQQHALSNMCGYNCLYICDIMEDLLDYMTPIEYDKVLYKVLGNTADGKDIKKLMKFAQQNGI